MNTIMDPIQREKLLEQAAVYARTELERDSSGHDWWHIVRVTRTAKRLAAVERADTFICELAALLHDVADEKLNPSKEAGLQKVENWLAEAGTDEADRAHVMDIISTMSFGGGHGQPMRTAEGRIVQDADRLDAIGAIGIARVFAYGGWKGRPMHDPELPVREHMTPEEYRSHPGTAINHFYEKLLKLKDLMNTNAARALAEERHRFMERYLEQFYSEWDAVDGAFDSAGENVSPAETASR
ncbi:HD domain-containing protein [Paenibacillus ehimensis]|uniref:HD domain-containing protein n=1 Tax=Paenibacillus ehimensis TaxID=79264 RepID=UPI002DBE29A8|nr:HD domain-containing protein [Paenibacillus ehimensis]MEC0212425.1 HD domain-containing protein [Paenibacillus ehimensis]